MTSKIARIVAAATLTLAFTTPTFAAIEIDEEDFGPTYETMVVDTIVGKPLQVVAAAAGTVVYVASLPFSVIAGNADTAQRKLFSEPWDAALGRCLGCTVAEDNYYDSQSLNDNEVRIVVDQPSEIIINTNENVIVMPY